MMESLEEHYCKAFVYAWLSFAMNRESIVLLKNEQKLLPISPHAQDIRTIALVGPNANASDILLGNYHGDPSQIISILEAMQQLFEGTRNPFPSLYFVNCNC